MARQLYQLADVQVAFAARIKGKVEGRRDQALDRAEAVPLLGWLLASITGIAFDLREGRNIRRGERGEETVLNTLLRKLPDTWSVFHSVVVEPHSDDFAQIDLLLIGPLTVPPPVPAQRAPTSIPICTRCNVPMVLRTAQQGANAGKQFYGCQNFPRCREIRPFGSYS